jgi:hypothetical protein
MRGVVTTLSAIAVLAVPATADAALTYPKARAQAQKAAATRARTQHNIVAYDVSRGFRFTSTKWVFVWFGQLQNGQGCGAQLVVRFASSRSSKAVTYFRNETCS